MANLRISEEGACDTPEMILENFNIPEYNEKIKTGLNIMHKKQLLTLFSKPKEVINFLYNENKTKEELKQLEIFKNKFIELFFRENKPIIKDITKENFEGFFDLLKFENKVDGETEKTVEQIKKIIEQNQENLNKPYHTLNKEEIFLYHTNKLGKLIEKKKYGYN